MPRVSAGLLLFRRGNGRAGEHLEVLLVLPGGPYFARRDEGWWTVPKGECEPGEDLLSAASREFAEELGSRAPEGARIELGSVTQRGGKVVHAFALEGDLDTSAVVSNEFEIEWPPRSGAFKRFPEIGRAGWFDMATARRKLMAAQVPFVDRLEAALGSGGG